MFMENFFTWLRRIWTNPFLRREKKKGWETRTIKEGRERKSESEREREWKCRPKRRSTCVAKERIYVCLHETQILKIYKIRSKTSSLPDCITLCHKRHARGETDVLLSLRLARIVLFRGFIRAIYNNNRLRIVMPKYNYNYPPWSHCLAMRSITSRETVIDVI